MAAAQDTTRTFPSRNQYFLEFGLGVALTKPSDGELYNWAGLAYTAGLNFISKPGWAIGAHTYGAGFQDKHPGLNGQSRNTISSPPGPYISISSLLFGKAFSKTKAGSFLLMAGPGFSLIRTYTNFKVVEGVRSVLIDGAYTWVPVDMYYYQSEERKKVGLTAKLAYQLKFSRSAGLMLGAVSHLNPSPELRNITFSASLTLGRHR